MYFKRKPPKYDPPRQNHVRRRSRDSDWRGLVTDGSMTLSEAVCVHGSRTAIGRTACRVTERQDGRAIYGASVAVLALISDRGELPMLVAASGLLFLESPREVALAPIGAASPTRSRIVRTVLAKVARELQRLGSNRVRQCEGNPCSDWGQPCWARHTPPPVASLGQAPMGSPTPLTLRPEAMLWPSTRLWGT
jgi:hypothetical protein